jgi:hypothetical protein
VLAHFSPLAVVLAGVRPASAGNEQIMDLRKLDRASLLIELARIACADAPLRASIAAEGPEALHPDQPVLAPLALSDPERDHSG